ncbi:MAG: hypothetical protein M3Q93_02280 [Gemmatimonadota bacterium]|nr:hypothetical protein [Gemmatimonadota bacterium]
MLLTLTACSGSGDDGLRASPAASAPDLPGEERIALAASFVGDDLGALERLLHDSVIVQPPSPDSALQGVRAIRYITDLAEHTEVTESRMGPSALSPEGPFLFEQGTWLLQAGDRPLAGSYTLRWRRTPSGWKVVLWRWSRFR